MCGVLVHILHHQLPFSIKLRTPTLSALPVSNASTAAAKQWCTRHSVLKIISQADENSSGPCRSSTLFCTYHLRASNAGVSNVAIACYLIRCAHTDESLVVLISQHTCNFPVRIGLDSTRRSHKQQGIATGDQVTDNFSTIRDISPNSASKPPDAPGSRSYCTHTMVSPVNPCLVILT